MFQLVLAHRGELVRAREYCEQGLTQYDPTLHGALAFRFGMDPGVALTGYAALIAWYLGYPDHALTRARDTWTLAQDLSHPPSQAMGALILSWVHFLRQEPALAQERIESVISLSTATEEVMVIPVGTMFKGTALAEQGHTEDGLALLQQGWSDLQAIGSRIWSSNFLLMMARVYGGMGRAEEGLAAIAEAEVFIAESEERWEEAELYRLKGELTLQSKVQGPKSKVEEAEAYFLKAIEISRRQQAKSLELRAVMSLARLWQQQGKHKEAHHMLAEIYGWFTEGFDAKDLQEAKTLLDELVRLHSSTRTAKA